MIVFYDLKTQRYAPSHIYDIDGNVCSATLGHRGNSYITPGSQEEKIFNATYDYYKKHYQ